jgi:anti-anti-sigma factor
VVVDLGSVPIVATSLLGVLTGGAQLIGTGGGELIVVTPDPRVRWLFDDSGLSRLARIEPTLADAVRHGHSD